MSKEFIEIIHARENNFKNISLKIPKNEITIFTGVSGSGKSSIVFDTIAQEVGRQLNETYPAFTRTFLPHYKRPDVDEIRGLATAITIDQKRLGGNARSTLGTITDINPLFRLLFSRLGKPQIGNRNMFSFNDPSEMCPKCEGIGKIITLNEEAALDLEKTIHEGAILLPGFGVGSIWWKVVADSGLFDNNKKLKDFTNEELETLLYSEAKPVVIEHGYQDLNLTFEGLSVRFIRLNVKNQKEMTKQSAKTLSEFAITCPCPVCNGKRYSEKTLSSKVMGYSIFEMTEMEIDKLAIVLEKIDNPMAKTIVNDIVKRLVSLCEIGLGYMNLTRETPTLSGGESQRVKMVKYLSNSLTGLLYIFDEPSTGLHPHDVHHLNELLKYSGYYEYDHQSGHGIFREKRYSQQIKGDADRWIRISNIRTTNVYPIWR